MPRTSAPWHVWPAGIAGVAWFGYGSYCYALLEIRDSGFVQLFPASVMQAIDALPYWVTAAWGLGLGAGLAGALLLLVRRPRAALAFAVSLVAGLASYAWRARAGALPEGAMIPAVSVALAAGLWLYCRQATR
jgi:hypothetical protein